MGNMQRISVFAAALAFASPFARAATYNTCAWQPVNGDYCGSFTNAAHWSGGFVPGSGYPDSTANINQIAQFPRVVGDYTVTLPQGLVTNVATPQFYAQPGHTLTIDGSQTTWLMPELASGEYYGDLAFYTGQRDVSGNPIDGSIFLNRRANTGTATAVGSFKNFTITLASETETVKGTRVQFTGDYDWTGGNVTLHRGTAAGGRSEIVFKDGTLANAPGMFIGFANPTNILTFDNFKLRCEWSSVKTGTGDTLASGLPGLLEVNLVNGTSMTNLTYLHETFEFGYSGSDNKTFRLNVRDGSLFRHSLLTMSTAGFHELNVSGKGSQVYLTHSNRLNSFGNAASSTSHVAIVDGGHFRAQGDFQFAGSTAEKAATSFADIVVSNATTYSRRSFKIGHGRVRLLDGAGMTFAESEGNCSFEGCGFDGLPVEFYADDATMHFQQKQSTSMTIFSNFTKAELGPKGLTLSAEGNIYYTVPQNFTNGTLTVLSRTSYPLTLSGTDSREENLVIARETVKLATGANHYANLIVTNGATYSLVGGATETTLRSLTLGDTTTYGTLALKSGDVVTVEGSINLVKAKITYSSTLATGIHTVLRTTVEPSAALVEQWEIGGVSLITSGLPSSYHLCSVVKSGDYWLFQIEVNRTRPTLVSPSTWQSGASWSAGAWSGGVPDETKPAAFDGDAAVSVTIAEARAIAGGLVFGNAAGVTISGGEMRLSDATDASISVTAGDNVINSDHRFLAETTINVAAGASLTVRGRAYGLGFTKAGSGRLLFENDANTFGSGFTLNGGWLAFDPMESMGYFNDLVTASLASGTLELPGTGESALKTTVTGPVVIQAEGDAAFGVGTATAGAIFKRGAGKATLDFTANTTLTLASSDSNTGYVTSDPVMTYPADGTIPEKYSAITVAEGELTLRGKGTTPTVTVKDILSVGAPVTDHSGDAPTEPGLVLDNVSAGGSTLKLGGGLSTSTTFAVEPYLVVSNGATWSSGLECCRNSELHGAKVFADRGTVYGVSTLNFETTGELVTNRFVLVNNSRLLSGRFANYGTVEIACTNSIVASAWDDADWSKCYTLEVASYCYRAAAHVTATFAKGSVFGCWRLACTNPKGYNSNGRWDLTFDGGEWWPGHDATYDIGSVSLAARIFTRGDGFVLNPEEGQIYRVITKVEGEGGLVKKGAGTVVVDCEYNNSSQYTAEKIVAAYTGLTDVQAGTLAITNGALANFEGRAFRVGGMLDLDGISVVAPVITAAGGTIRNATLVRPIFKVEYDDEGQPKGITLDGVNGCALSGRVVFDFDNGGRGATALPVGTELTVATWTGTKPDVANWRSKNVGDGLKCSFVANDSGAVVATVRSPGFRLIVR